METSAVGLHPAFTIDRHDGWLWDRNRDEAGDRGVNLKVRFLFNRGEELPDLPMGHDRKLLLAKIGPSRGLQSLYKYCGFMYGQGKDRPTLEAWGRHCPLATLIIGLDRDGRALPDAQRVLLTK